MKIWRAIEFVIGWAVAVVLIAGMASVAVWIVCGVVAVPFLIIAGALLSTSGRTGGDGTEDDVEFLGYFNEIGRVRISMFPGFSMGDHDGRAQIHKWLFREI